MSYVYDRAFFDYIDRGARISAEKTLRRALTALRPDSVLDVGCGRGVWLSEWLGVGAQTVTGIDGPWVERDRLAIPEADFHAADLTHPIDLKRRFDLVQSLEVAEHLPREASDTFIDTLCRHGDVVLFSAAVPGQGGENHLNERPLSYWRELFAARGYQPFDAVRPALRGLAMVEPWYRYNTILYANASGAARLPAEIARSLIPKGRPIPPVLDPLWLVRRAFLQMMPRKVVTAGARLRAIALNAAARRRAARF